MVILKSVVISFTPIIIVEIFDLFYIHHIYQLMQAVFLQQLQRGESELHWEETVSSHLPCFRKSVQLYCPCRLVLILAFNILTQFLLV